MKFLFLGKGVSEASTRYRIQPIYERLAKAGHQVEFVSTELGLLPKLNLVRRANQYDLVFIQRKLFPAWFVRSLKRRAGRLVFDFDDAIFLKSSGESSPSRYRKFQATCQAADLILAGNEYLAMQSRKLSTKVQVVPTTVDTAAYETDAVKASAITLVWIGSSSTRRYLDMLTPVLDSLSQRRPNLMLKVIADFEFRLDGLKVENIQWSAEQEVAELTSSHIGIAPMINNGWTRGKCALKVIQYMAAGLPVVSDRCGANQEVILASETGYLADNENDWIEAITKLIDNEDLRTQMGVAGRARAQQLYDMKRVTSQVADQLVELCGD
ncbi:MAG: glycosyltransferase involved in cell wall biosynthesis [Patiriisocius sp.]